MAMLLLAGELLGDPYDTRSEALAQRRLPNKTEIEKLLNRFPETIPIPEFIPPPNGCFIDARKTTISLVSAVNWLPLRRSMIGNGMSTGKGTR